MTSPRYIGDIQSTEPETYRIVDTFTGKDVAKDISGMEDAQARTDRLNARHAEAMDLAQRIASFVNRAGSSESDQFVSSMSFQHRTLQQGFTGLAVAWLNHLAQLKDGEYDGRNEASVKLAKAVTQAEDWWKLSHLPCI